MKKVFYRQESHAKSISLLNSIMIKQSKIVDYLLDKYKPLAIYMSGSRARNRHRPNSDWDIHLVVFDYVVPISEKVFGESIDIKFIIKSKIKEFTIDTPYSPAVPFVVLFRDESHKIELLDLESRTTEAYKKGPNRWDEFLLVENRNRMLRFLEAINGTMDDEIICFRHMCKFFDLALLYWFLIRSEWPVPIYESVEKFKETDFIFYDAINSFVVAEQISDKVKQANNIFNILFKTK